MTPSLQDIMQNILLEIQAMSPNELQQKLDKYKDSYLANQLRELNEFSEYLLNREME